MATKLLVPEATVSVVDVDERLLEYLDSVSDRLGCATELQSVLAIADRGPSYVRQREVVAAGGSLSDVVDRLVAELKLDEPAARP